MPSLAQELRKRHEFALPEQEATLNIVRTATRLIEAGERVLKPHGISGPLYNILRIVRGIGGDGVPSGEIGVQMVTPTPDVTRLVDRLEKLQLAARSRKEGDRRVVLVRLTPKGRRLLTKLDPIIEQMHRDTLGHLTPSELRSINELMVRVRDSPALGKPSGCQPTKD
ncbi:MarR family winged helix-turn-helix transcriptional regulator [Botrimarina mediterranea]|uniref:Transcriptional repressor MprA n=1 Tax=Botrimarina mediterranea TaxID=2528022 RepID=A0A518K335_9BACT|nr:MarR family transcriptional regulator [Botrimarina mediterranea]QDV72189.1 Transcriptional repressor MprA [Botrimarina mediterranea]QDV76732.1 Transcriptional repressor MprA [Planctomycetes bacterium K2D]